mgnify:FL=1
MMDPKEVRICNLVNYNEDGYGFDDYVVIIEPHEIHTYRTIAERIKNAEFHPIPITPEWLERLGFEKRISPKGHENWVMYSQHHFAFVLREITPFIGFTYHSYGTDHSLQIDHVHQLQNLYHALTGQELTVKELTPTTT